MECIIFHVGDAVRNRHAGQTRAAEAILPDARDAIGDHVASRLSCRVHHDASHILVKQDAVHTARIGWIGIVHHYRDQTCAGSERRNPHGCDTGGDRDSGQTVATDERLVPEAGDVVWNRHTGQPLATSERVVPDPGDRQTIDFVRDGDIPTRSGVSGDGDRTVFDDVCERHGIRVGGSRNESKAEARVHPAPVRVAAAAERGTAAERDHGPSAAPAHPLRTHSRPRRVMAASELIPKQILAPFIDVAVHVIEAPRIRWVAGDGTSLPLGLIDIRLLGVESLPKAKCGLRSGAAGILPLRLGGQGCRPAGRQALGQIELGDEKPGIIPTHRFHRQIIAFEIAGVVAHDRHPLPLRAFRLRHPEALAELHLHLVLIRLAVRLRGWTAHLETAGGTVAELHHNSAGQINGHHLARCRTW